MAGGAGGTALAIGCACARGASDLLCLADPPWARGKVEIEAVDSRVARWAGAGGNGMKQGL